MMEAVVKYRLIHWYEPVEDYLGNTVMAERLASHGQTITTEEGTNTETKIHNVPEKEFRRMQAIPGAFFSEAEVDAMSAIPADDDFDSTSPLVTTQTGSGSEAHPLAFGEMSEDQLVAYLATQPDLDTLVDAVEEQPTQRESVDLGNRFLSASIESDYRHHDGLTQAVAAIAGVGTGAGSDDDPDGSSSEGGEPGGDGEPGGEPGVDGGATEAATEYALAHDVDLSKVTGTGTGGRITQPDVQQYLNSQQ